MIKLAGLGFVLASSFTDYPAFIGHRGVVEAWTDRGPIVELIVRCPVGAGIVSYSKIERVYCSSKHGCYPALRPAVIETCN